MSSYDVIKKSKDLYTAGSESMTGAFQFEKQPSSAGGFEWRVFAPNDPRRVQHCIDHDESRALLINKLQAGGYDHHLIESFTVGGQPMPVRNRNVLLNPKTGNEGFAPIGVIHWWEKGYEPHTHFKCDLHFEDGGFEAGGDTLEEALRNLACTVEFSLTCADTE
jgi:hypothetical protein